MAVSRKSGRAGVTFWTVAMLLAACSEAPAVQFEIAGHRYDTGHVTHLALPKKLREVSGLELAADGRLYAHNDERGVVYTIDYAAPQVASAELTDPTGNDFRDDFEGIATLHGRLFLVTSRGRLYESSLDDAGDTATAIRHAGVLPCEVEGLTAAPDGESLIAVCKNLPEGESGIVAHGWDPDRQAYAASPALSVDQETLTAFLEDRFPGRPVPRRIQPTGITVTGSGNLLIVAGRQYLLLEFTPAGLPVAAAPLDPAVHRQAEGIVVDTQGRLFLTSEGDGKGDKKTPGVLSIYEPID